MPANEAQQLLNRFGIQPRPDYSGHGRPRLRHTGDLDALREAAISNGPASVEYGQWMSILQNGEDQNLPDVDAFNGAIPMSVAGQQRALSDAQRSAQQQWTSAHPLLNSLRGPDGRSLADSPVEVAVNAVALLAAEGRRQEAHDLQSAIALSEHTSVGVTWVAPEENLEYTVSPDASTVGGDFYSNWRSDQQAQSRSLQIRHASADAALFAGVSSDGLSYERSADWSAPSNSEGGDNA